MIPFGGAVRGEIFQGIVEPCGVDTQVLNQAGVRHMSARYMLTGQDSQGQEAHIYVENNGLVPRGSAHALPHRAHFFDRQPRPGALPPPQPV